MCGEALRLDSFVVLELDLDRRVKMPSGSLVTRSSAVDVACWCLKNPKGSWSSPGGPLGVVVA